MKSRETDIEGRPCDQRFIGECAVVPGLEKDLTFRLRALW